MFTKLTELCDEFRNEFPHNYIFAWYSFIVFLPLIINTANNCNQWMKFLMKPEPVAMIM